MSRVDRDLVEIFMSHYGIDILMFDESFVNKIVLDRMDLSECFDITDYCRYVAENQTEAELFTDLLHVSYSKFFRNPLTFSVLESIVLPEIIARKRDYKSKEIRIWSAACAGGHEAYSMAMLLENYNGQKEQTSYRIFGTDQDENQISAALMGEYSKESVGNVRQKQLEKWFIQSANSYAIIPELKKHCEFSVFDLLSKLSSPPGSIYGDFDLVFCANVLFYYKPEYRKKILNKIGHSLAEDGLLITGKTEREIVKAGNFKEVFPHSAIFRIK
jgi:chemotaxis protein methyltransferase CheR